MFNKKTLRFLPIVLLIFFITIPSTDCKKQSTVPDVSDLTRPVIWLNLFNMSFTTYEVGPNPSAQILKIKNSGQQTLEYTLADDVDWLSVSPENGTSTGQINEHTIFINKSGLTAQDEDYAATITITSSQAYNNPQTVSVNLNVSKEPPPEIWVSTKQFNFSAEEDGANPPSQTLRIRNNGSSTLNYQITKNVAWLNVNPTNGTVKTGEKSHTVSVNIGGLSEGSYKGTITVTDPNATNSPQHVNVSLSISAKLPPGPPPPPPSTKNEVGISISPSSGGTSAIVTITVFIDGNTSQISSAFGLELHYNTSIFQYLDTSKGTLTGSWAAVDGGASAGTITVGGFRGSGSVIPVGSQGSIAIVRLRVIYSGSSQSTQITMSNLIDDLVGMIINPGSATFTYIP